MMLERALAVVLLAAIPAACWAQRTGNNAVTAAEDAFGTSVGDQTIGIYNSYDVRGFSPADAGNLRIEGLYFDQQAGLTGRLLAGSTIRVGISAQGYPFPAPTGVADFALRKPGGTLLVSAAVNLGPFGSKEAEVDLQIPIDGERLGIATGMGIYRDINGGQDSPNFFSVAAVLRYAPRAGVEIKPFAMRIRQTDSEAEPLIFTNGAFLPKRFDRTQFLGQPWNDTVGTATNFGVLARTDPFGLEVRLGLFRSQFSSDVSANDLLFGTDANGRVARRVIIRERGDDFASTSGELRVSKALIDGKRRHTFIASLRGRQQDRRYGGAAFAELGSSRSDVVDIRPEPVTTDGAKTNDRVTQTTFGLAYRGQWAGVGEIGLGVQKTRYAKSVTDPDPTIVRPETHDAPLLFSATGALFLTKKLALYSGYTRGLEESPVAPSEAVNRNEAPPAIRTEQKDAGLRWFVSPGVTAVAGVFDISKPYFNIDSTGRFRQLESFATGGSSCRSQDRSPLG